jgi:uncharacterized protein with HEPN domain
MLDIARDAVGLLGDRPRAAYDADRTLRLALAHLVQTIGEAARRVSRDFCDAHSEVPWQAIIGMRHRVVHDYLNLDEDILWDTVTKDLPVLMCSSTNLSGFPLPPDPASLWWSNGNTCLGWLSARRVASRAWAVQPALALLPRGSRGSWCVLWVRRASANSRSAPWTSQSGYVTSPRPCRGEALPILILSAELAE